MFVVHPHFTKDAGTVSNFLKAYVKAYGLEDTSILQKRPTVVGDKLYYQQRSTESGYSFDFSVPGLTKADLDVEVSREANWDSNKYVLRVKTLASTAFVPKTEAVLVVPANLDVSTASTALADGILTVTFKHDAKSQKRNYKLEVK